MDFVPPIHGIGEESIFAASMSKSAAAFPSNTTPPTEPDPVSQNNPGEVDFIRLQNDKKYALTVLNWTLYRARSAFNRFRYTEAQHFYELFFKYMRYNRANYIYGGPISYVQPLFEYTWTREIQGGKAEAEKFLKLQLLQLFEPPVNSGYALPKELRQSIQQLQSQGLLPSATRLDMEVMPDKLMTLAQQAQTMGQTQFALKVLEFVQIYHMLQVFRTERLAGSLSSEKNNQSNTLLPFSYQHFSIPVAPVLPQPEDMMQRVSSKITEYQYYVDKVEPVYALNKDPRDEEKRRRRQKRPDLLKGKVKKPKRKPQITI